jgi:hypothetical protein
MAGTAKLYVRRGELFRIRGSRLSYTPDRTPGRDRKFGVAGSFNTSQFNIGSDFKNEFQWDNLVCTTWKNIASANMLITQYEVITCGDAAPSWEGLVESGTLQTEWPLCGPTRPGCCKLQTICKIIYEPRVDVRQCQYQFRRCFKWQMSPYVGKCVPQVTPRTGKVFSNSTSIKLGPLIPRRPKKIWSRNVDSSSRSLMLLTRYASRCWQQVGKN